MKMVVLCPYPPDRAPSQRLKFEQYYPSWRDAGWEVDVRPFWDDEAWGILHRPGHTPRKAWAMLKGMVRRLGDVTAAAKADLVYVHLDVLPLGPPILERYLVRAAPPVVYDIDDLVHHPHSSDANRFMRWLRGPSRVKTLVRGAAHVIVCTPFLESWARDFNDQVTDISSTIDTEEYVPVSPRADARKLTLGWSGSHSTAQYLHLLDEVLRDLAGELDFRLKVIGDADFRIDGVEVHAQSWRLETEVEDLQDIDIGLYPLPHEDWVLGKSGLKALQYMALGVPTVATDLGANSRIIRDGENGFLVSDEEEWKARIRQLALDPLVRRRLGEAARSTVVERFSVQANEAAYLEVLERVAGVKPGESQPNPRS